MLTKGVDDLGGTAGNDTIIAAIDANAESNTLNTGDVIDGGAGKDTLDLTIGANLNPTVTVKNVEVLEVRNAAVAGNVDMRNTDGAVKTIVEKQSTNGFTANFIAAADVAVSIKDVTTAALVSDYNWNAGALAGAADAASLTLNNVVGTAAGRHIINLDGGAANQGFETVNVKTEGAASNLATLNVRDNGVVNTMTKLAVTGDQNLTIANTAFAATGGQIDASAFTGNLTVNAVNAVDVDFKGGKGNDTILFGATLQATDKIDGGDGTDTLGANAFADLQAAFTAGRVSNIEAIRIEQAIATINGTLDVARAGNVNSVSVNGIGANTNAINNLQDNATLTVTANTAGGTLNANIKDATLAGTANTLTVNLGTAADAVAIAAGTIGAAGVETLNVGSLGTTASGAGTNTVTITGNADLAKMVVTGAEDVTVTFTGGGAALKEFDASKATGIQNTSNIAFSGSGASIAGGNKADVLLGGAGNDTIVGGAGNDVLTGGMGSDVLTGGEGSDTFRLGTNGNAANATNTIVDSITDFVLGSGNDVIDLSLLANNLRPLQNGDVSSTVVKALNGALPTGGTNGTAELIILDSSVADMRAADSQALNAKLFNLAGASNQGQVLVAYSATDGGNVRLAVANITGGDITNVTDLAVLNGVTTDSLASGFNAANLTGFQVNAQFTVAAALAAGNAGLPNGATIADTGAAIAGLSAAQIAGFTNVATIDATDNAITLTVAQELAADAKLVAADAITVADTGANIATLTAAQLGSAMIDTIDATDNAITLTVAQELAADAKLVVGETTVADTGANIAAMTVAQLGSAKIGAFNATNDVLTLSAAQAAAITNAKLTAGDTVTLSDTGANLAAVTAAAYTAYTNVDAVDATDNTLALTAAQAAAITNAKLTAADTVTLADTGANLAAVTAAAYTAYTNVDAVDATDNTLALTAAQAAAITNAKLTAGDTVTLSDTGANLAAVTAAAYTAYTNVDAVDATDNTLVLTAAQAAAITNAKLTAADTVTLTDTAANIQALSAATLGAYTNVDAYDSTDNTLSLSVAQATAIGNKFTAADVVTIADTGANLAANVGGLGTNFTSFSTLANTDILDASDNAVSLTNAQFLGVVAGGPLFAANDVITLGMTTGADTIAALGGAHVAAGGVEVVKYTAGNQASSLAFTNVATGTVLDDTDTFAVTLPDLITGFTAGTDKLDLSSFNLLGASAATQFTATGSKVGDGEYIVVRGDYVGGTFTAAAATGADTLVVWDGNTAAGGVTMVGVVLQGTVASAADLILA